ncbi:DUF4935 domain-containing protein [Geomonas terrae]|uniref:DUF4935 domain-containing protein n=1 Tax=Geomonas terrae TaxID=2562681 RepID=A0A4S1CDT7_9BACT|nr:PIN domain-containing protein [Geomonas terrae]TGU71638.1 DUF4935 domain-containing protein [Geomonas terrae]
MPIVLDTNIFFKDFYLTKPQTSVMLDNIALIKSIVCVPQVVFDEVVNKFTEEVSSRLNIISKAMSELDEMLEAPISNDIDAQALQHYRDKYNTSLVNTFRKHKIKKLPYPTIAHHIVVQRDLARKLPFKPKGTGYRDCLIWETIKEALVTTELAVMGHNDVAFITDNVTDFGDNEGIAAELKEELHDRHSVTLFRSVKDFNEAFIYPKLASVKSIDAKLSDIGFDQHPLPLWLHNNLATALTKSTKKQVILEYLGLPININSVSISKVDNINNFNINKSAILSSGEFFLSVSFESNIKSRIDINSIDYHNHDSVRSYLGRKIDGLFCHKYETFSVAISMSIVLVTTSSDIHSYDVDIIDIVKKG